ncbi:MAG TPA: iron ABC transporter permease [Bacillota bacterium]|nr:iron ABC transporter permease [Bacillota bacterium]
MKKRATIGFLYFLVFLSFYLPVLYVFYQLVLMEDLFLKLAQFIRSGVFWKTLSFSLSQAGISAALSILLSLPGAYFWGRFNFRGKQFSRSLLVLPFMMPGIVIVLGMVVFYGKNGLFNQLLSALFSEKIRFTGLYSYWGIVLAHVIYNLPLCLRMLGESWERIDPKLREASINLGAGPFFTGWRLTLPLILPTIVYLFLVVFVYSFLSFTVVLVFGGYLYKTFEVLIYIEYNSKLRFEEASMIAGLQTLILLFIFWLQSLFQRKGYAAKPAANLPRLCFHKNPLQTVGFYIYHIIILLFLATPFLTVIQRSFLEGGTFGNHLSLENYQLLFGEGFRFSVGASFGKVVLTSCFLSTAVALVTTIVAYVFAKDRQSKPWGITDLLLQLPLGISFMSFGFGLGSLAGDLLPAWLLLMWAHFYLAFPLVYSIMRTAWRDFDYSMIESSYLLGASPRHTLLAIEAPLIRKAVQTAFIYGMAISLSDLGAVLLLGRGEVITISVAIYRLIGHYRFAQGTALATIFMGIAFLAFLAVEKDWITKREDSH